MVDLSGETAATVLCPECGELIEVKDVRAIIMTLHLQNNCPVMEVVFGERS